MAQLGEVTPALHFSHLPPSTAMPRAARIPGTYLPSWPNASNRENYAAVFNKQCPQAYSWQFNDDQSTYQCRKADYKVSFLSTHKKSST